jgi:hypothetical protein
MIVVLHLNPCLWGKGLMGCLIGWKRQSLISGLLRPVSSPTRVMWHSKIWKLWYMMKNLHTSWWKLRYGSSNVCFAFICKSRSYHCNVELDLGILLLVLFYFVECSIQIVFHIMKDFMDYFKNNDLGTMCIILRSLKSTCPNIQYVHA